MSEECSRRSLKVGGGVMVLMALVAIWAIGMWAAVAESRERPTHPAAEYTEAQIELYEAMYKATLTPSAIALSNMAEWSDETVATVLAASLLVVTEPTSLATWKPGYENWLRNTMGLGEQEVIDAVYAVYGARAWRILRAVSGQKPG